MPLFRASMRAVITAAATLAIAASLLSLTAAPSNAALASPAELSPSGSTADGIPVLTWQRVAGAANYDVQVSRSSTFTTTVWTLNTVNHQAVPQVQLAEGEVWWRVRAIAGSETSGWAEASFTRSAIGKPVLSSPGDGAELQQPNELPALAWNPVAGANKYTIQISIDPNFTDPTLVKTYERASTTFVLTDLGVPSVYYWRVRGTLDNGVLTDWSDSRSYRILGLALPDPWLPEAPVMNDNANVFTYVRDAVLDWDPVPGASTYQLQVSTDQNFNTVLETRIGITGTSYARPQTLNNDQYYWRVRPVDASGNTLDWSSVPIWKFGRNWPHQPVLEYPQHNSTVGDPFYYQWTGVEHASHYQLEVSKYPTFEVPTDGVENMVCETTHTTWTSLGSDVDEHCRPRPEGTYYWRVRAIDSSHSGDGPVSDTTLGVTPVHRFTYSPDRVTLVSPQPGSTTQLPVLTWEPLPLAAKYRVQVFAVSTGNAVVNALTTSLTYTPRSVLPAGEYRWQVMPVTQGGSQGVELLPGSQPRFTVAASTATTGAVPEPDVAHASTSGGVFQRFPNLRWSPVTGATRYRVLIRAEGATAFTWLGEMFAYPAGEDPTSLYLTPGDYEWMVEAYAGSTYQSESTGLGRFTIAPSSSVTGHEVALTGTALSGAAGSAVDTCDASLPNTCQNLRQTPVLRWDPSPDAGYYRMYLSYDPELTNLVREPFEIHATMWASSIALPDSQAGSAYFWEVVPCKAGVCSPPPHATHAFNKLSNQVELVGPGVPVATPQPARPVLSDDITLDWKDYLATSTAAAQGTSALVTAARAEARSYRVETSTDPAFTTVIERVDVDQTSFTSFANTYPEGPIYWRVQAFDGTGNPLPWSEVRTFQKESPTPSLTYPTQDEVVHGHQRFSWTSLPFAAAYDIEIYRKDGPTDTRIVSASTKQVSYTPEQLLAAGASYNWRVRRSDAKGRKGAWSASVPFTVGADAPTLVAPGQGAELTPVDGLFSWAVHERARSYRFERRISGSASIAETVNTPALAWAPRTALSGGAWQWRVTPIDAAGAALGSSGWRDFTVIDTPLVLTPVAITGSGKVGAQLTLTPPVWNIPDVTTTYQWLRNGAAIRYATTESYVVTAADVSTNLTVRATGTRSGYQPGISVSNAIGGALGAILLPTEPPAVVGIPAVGQTLAASDGSWPGDPDFQYHWYRERVPIEGADNSTYRVQATDAGRRITVRVTAEISGYEPGAATSSPITIRRIASGTQIEAPRTISRSKRVPIVVTVSAADVASPSGSVRIYVDRRLVKTVTLSNRMRGRFSVRLSPLKKVGKHTVKVAYSGSSALTASTRTVTIKATR